MAISVVLFDLGSTLLYFDADPNEILPQMDLALARSLNRQGFTLDEAAFSAEFARRETVAERLGEEDWIEITTFDLVHGLLAELGHRDVPEAIIRRGLEEYYALSQLHWQLEIETIPTLQHLRRSGYRLGIVSNDSDAADAYKLLEQHHLAEYFEAVWVSAEIGLCKPHPHLFELALGFFHVAANQAVMVGDRLDTDIRGAQNAGLHNIWITRRAKQPKNNDLCDQIIPEVILSNLAEIPGQLASYPS